MLQLCSSTLTYVKVGSTPDLPILLAQFVKILYIGPSVVRAHECCACAGRRSGH